MLYVTENRFFSLQVPLIYGGRGVIYEEILRVK